MKYSVKVHRKKPKSSFVRSQDTNGINWRKTKVDIIASSDIYALGIVLETQLYKHMLLYVEVPTEKDFISPKIALFIQRRPNNYGCGRNTPLGKIIREIVLTGDLHTTGVLYEPQAAVP